MTPQYDVIIIGGGINGAAIASAVGARGYRTLVLEQGDFASGTTSASTKLIHGGLRYLETGDARLVHESLQSRERLLRERPHLVQPLGFLLPVYHGDPRPAAVIRSGLLLYDLLSPRKVTPWHRSFSTPPAAAPRAVALDRRARRGVPLLRRPGRDARASDPGISGRGAKLGRRPAQLLSGRLHHRRPRTRARPSTSTTC